MIKLMDESQALNAFKLKPNTSTNPNFLPCTTYIYW